MESKPSIKDTIPVQAKNGEMDEQHQLTHIPLAPPLTAEKRKRVTRNNSKYLEENIILPKYFQEV